MGEDLWIFVGGGYWVYFWDGLSSEFLNFRDMGLGGDFLEKGVFRVEVVILD